MALFQAFGSNDSDAGSPGNNQVSTGNNILTDPQPIRNSVKEQQSHQTKEIDNSPHEADIPIVIPASEHLQSVGELLSSIRPGHNLPVSGLEGGATRPMSKTSGSNIHSKRSSFWGRNSVSFSSPLKVSYFNQLWEIISISMLMCYIISGIAFCSFSRRNTGFLFLIVYN